ncbi:NERD domain-containing protein [Brevibacterium sp. RIT803]|nr:NERD domain-containing protein [Brevibacterium sp. RIT 803]
MVTLIPQQPDFNGSTAEEAVWNSLCEQLPDETTMVHGQRLTGDDKDVEIDILVLWPGIGIAVVESRAVGSESRMLVGSHRILRGTAIDSRSPLLSRRWSPSTHLSTICVRGSRQCRAPSATSPSSRTRSCRRIGTNRMRRGGSSSTPLSSIRSRRRSPLSCASTSILRMTTSIHPTSSH